MAVGTVSTRILTDIANAIRFKAGVATTYKPREMAAAVAALDGSHAGDYRPQDCMELESGVLSESVFADIADAIRGQNGLTRTYQPGEMAQAILDLVWDVGLKPRAVLSSTGVLEFNYVDRRRVVSGGVAVDAWEVSASYSSAGARPWDDIKTQVTKVVIDSSFAQSGILNCAYWFNGFTNLVEASGFENLSGMTAATQMFTGCGKLETIYATSFDNSAVTGSSFLYGCNKLVGGTDGFVPTTTSGASVFKLGAGGVLTDPNADNRIWLRVFAYTDGVVEFTMGETPDTAKTLVEGGRLCANAKYQAVGVVPGFSARASMDTVVFRSSLAALASVNMCYWFYSWTATTSFVGLENIPNVQSMRYAFTSCQALEELDFRGFDPSHLTDLFYAFSGCNKLKTIYADANWELPSSGISGNQCFYNCNALTGGNGTTYASSRTAYTYFRIDKAGSPGYITVA